MVMDDIVNADVDPLELLLYCAYLGLDFSQLFLVGCYLLLLFLG
jgi:hypothetical protein